ncbi:MAG TPA: GNAT family N-acetyltransferase [Caulobacteraceae bacterium]|nr:GNAT family N-acetyltransferase [Caulobacteraceae bacterium]
MQLSIARADDDDKAAGREIGELLYRSNVQLVGKPAGERFVLTIKAPGSDEILGGLVAISYWGSFYISDVVVPQEARGAGLGAELMRQAEQEARARGCRHMWLDTFEFQARPFYERLGFEVFGRLDGLAPFFPRYFMQKTLIAPAGG